jgi:hypothetical protein
MSWNLIIRPGRSNQWRARPHSLLGEKSSGPLQDLALLAQHLVLAPQTLELGNQILLSIRRWLFHLSVALPVNPGAQGRETNPEVTGDLATGPPAGPGQPHGLGAKLRRKLLLRF